MRHQIGPGVICEACGYEHYAAAQLITIGPPIIGPPGINPCGNPYVTIPQPEET